MTDSLRSVNANSQTINHEVSPNYTMPWKAVAYAVDGVALLVLAAATFTAAPLLLTGAVVVIGSALLIKCVIESQQSAAKVQYEFAMKQTSEKAEMAWLKTASDNKYPPAMREYGIRTNNYELLREAALRGDEDAKFFADCSFHGRLRHLLERLVTLNMPEKEKAERFVNATMVIMGEEQIKFTFEDFDKKAQDGVNPDRLKLRAYILEMMDKCKFSSTVNVAIMEALYRGKPFAL